MKVGISGARNKLIADLCKLLSRQQRCSLAINVQLGTGRLAAMDKIATDDEEDELMLYNDDSDADDGTGYRPLEPLPGSQARIYTTKDLHGMSCTALTT